MASYPKLRVANPFCNRACTLWIALCTSLLAHLLIGLWADWQPGMANVPDHRDLQVKLGLNAVAPPARAQPEAGSTRPERKDRARHAPEKTAPQHSPKQDTRTTVSATPAAPPAVEQSAAKSAGGEQQAAIESAAAAPAAARFVPASSNAAYLNNPLPEHPAASRRAGREEEGRVILRVSVLASGLVESVSIEQSSGFFRLDKAARDAVLRWRFVPARRGEEAVPDTVLVPISFRLHD